MIILDFSLSNFNYKKLQAATVFEQEILNFLENWYNDDKKVEVQTSGSTGIPKKMMLTKSNMKKSAELTGKYLSLEKGNTALLAMPVNYIAGKMMLVRAIVLGLKLICSTPRSVFLWEDFQQLNLPNDTIDFVALTPMQVEKSIDFVSHCRCLIIGGAPLNQHTKDKLYKFRNRIFETYAMTETITHIAFKQLRNEQYPNQKNSFEVFDEIEISQDARSCLQIKTPYYDEILTTNDVVEILSGKEFIWIGRADNIINSGGIKLYPEKIEEKLKPYLQRAFYVSSKRDDLLGEKLILMIEGDPFDFQLDDIDFNQFEKPKEIIFQPQFDRTESGKIKRRKL
ncbi:AMP-binding protein [Weeksella virosa]|uniref:AMP-binding protein n=1 Tax=Weeksella virosa TaxID=1014 RepID=UPI00255386AE|nr:AMP-binding protein [Weeksella virosa]MDK7375133.1 AMP-binding protein [Weeksella virosa]